MSEIEAGQYEDPRSGDPDGQGIQLYKPSSRIGVTDDSSTSGRRGPPHQQLQQP